MILFQRQSIFPLNFATFDDWCRVWQLSELKVNGVHNGNWTEWSAICIGNSTVSRDIWDKYREWYFKIHLNITSRRGEWYLGSFEISRAGIYPKYPEEIVLFFVYTTRQRNFAFHITQEHIFLFSHAQLIGFTTTCDWLWFLYVSISNLA